MNAGPEHVNDCDENGNLPTMTSEDGVVEVIRRVH